MKAAGGPPSARRTTRSWTSTQERVTGSITLRLARGTVTIAGRASEHALYDERFVTFGEDDVYEQSDAAGFIRLFGLSTRVRALKDQEPPRSGKRCRGPGRAPKSRGRSHDAAQTRRRRRRTSSGEAASAATPHPSSMRSIARSASISASGHSTSDSRKRGPSRSGTPASLTLDESRTLEHGLDAVAARLAAGAAPVPIGRRRAHADRPAPARRSGRRRLATAHRPQPQRSGRDGHTALGDGRRVHARRRGAHAAAV